MKPLTLNSEYQSFGQAFAVKLIQEPPPFFNSMPTVYHPTLVTPLDANLLLRRSLGEPFCPIMVFGLYSLTQQKKGIQNRWGN